MRLGPVILAASLAAAPLVASATTAVGTCQATVPEIDIGSASSLMSGYDPIRATPAQSGASVLVTWTLTTIPKNGAHVTVTLSSPTGTMSDPSSGTPLAYTIYYGSGTSGKPFGNGAGGTTNYMTTQTANGSDTFAVTLSLAASQDVKVSKTPLSYADTSLQLQCAVS